MIQWAYLKQVVVTEKKIVKIPQMMLKQQDLMK